MGDCKRQDFLLSKSVHLLRREGGSFSENTSFSAGGLGLASLRCVLEFPSAKCRAKDNTAKSDVLAWGDALSRGFLLLLNAGSPAFAVWLVKRKYPEKDRLTSSWKSDLCARMLEEESS